MEIEALKNVHEDGCDGYHCTCKLKASVTELIPDFIVEVELEDSNSPTEG